MKYEINICPAPDLFDKYYEKNCIVIMVDAIRASATICTALHYGVSEIVAEACKDKALSMREFGYMTAGERNGIKLDEFDFGNSPLSFQDENLKGKKLAFSTTNGTRAIEIAAKQNPDKLVIGSFINFSALFDWLENQNKNVLILCSGWKGTINIEDLLFAGKLASKLIKTSNYFFEKDAVSIAMNLYSMAKDDFFNFVMMSSPRLNSKLQMLENDIRYCLSMDITKKIPIYIDGKIVPLEN